MIRVGTAIRSNFPKERSNMKRIIYEKTYDHSLDFDIPEEEISESSMPSAEEFIRSLNEDSEYVLVEERLQGLEVFIKVVKDVSEILEADVEIYEQPFGATANLKLQDCTFEQYVKKVFTFMLVKADAISWFTKDNYTLLSLDYYTHELYYKGECKHRITQTA